MDFIIYVYLSRSIGRLWLTGAVAIRISLEQVLHYF